MVGHDHDWHMSNNAMATVKLKENLQARSRAIMRPGVPCHHSCLPGYAQMHVGP